MAGVVGEIVHLEKTGRGLWAVCEFPGAEGDPAAVPSCWLSAVTGSAAGNRNSAI